MKLGFLGYLGFSGLLGFWHGRFFGLFFLFLLFLLDVFPKKGKGLFRIGILVVLTLFMTLGNVLDFYPAELLSDISGLAILLFWALIMLFPAGRNIIDEEALSKLCDPLTHEDLAPGDADGSPCLKNMATGKIYPVIKNIPQFSDPDSIGGLNKKYLSLYNGFSFFYDLCEKLIYIIFFGGEGRKRKMFLKDLDIKPGNLVLETSIGTGGNIHYLPKGAIYHGMDISMGMLRMCLKNLGRWGRKAYIVQGEAEFLPYKDNTFDTVFHFGGINFFNDKKKALEEMIRVAKPGAKLLISDETEQVAEGMKSVPFNINEFYENKGLDIIKTPVDIIPETMQNIKSRLFAEDTLYSITFNKPGKN
jgi:ubiquinone/menaquinone biosynthesis C-methylase UbiE